MPSEQCHVIQDEGTLECTYLPGDEPVLEVKAPTPPPLEGTKFDVANLLSI